MREGEGEGEGEGRGSVQGLPDRSAKESEETCFCFCLTRLCKGDLSPNLPHIYIFLIYLHILTGNTTEKSSGFSCVATKMKTTLLKTF